MLSTKNICLTIEYDGTGFFGWQAQTYLPTIEGCLRSAASAMGLPIEHVHCAGRTDAGVHAQMQVVNFHCQYTREVARLAPAFNAFLPPSIRVLRAQQANASFSARFDSIEKHYRYVVCNQTQPSSLLRHRSWHVRKPLHADALQHRALLLIGEHNFESFRASHCDAAHAIRRLSGLSVVAQPTFSGQLIYFDLYANAFCRHMCRIIVGTLVQHVGQALPLSALQQVMLAQNRRAAGVTAPAMGLCLMAVRYADFIP